MNISNNIDNIIVPNNKKLLWETLHTNGAFSNFKQEQLGEVKHIFDEEINVEYFNNVNNVNFNLLQSNRNIILNIINKLNVLNNNNVNSVDNKLKEKEKEFNDLINKPEPPDINFNDAKDNDNFNMEESLNKIKEERNYDNNSNDINEIKNDIKNMKEKIQNMESMINSLAQKFVTLNVEKNIEKNKVIASSSITSNVNE
tara:strand:+ start:170 stop:769 length:600 start_codon:yes stop_codon:yes gene_type:complete